MTTWSKASPSEPERRVRALEILEERQAETTNAWLQELCRKQADDLRAALRLDVRQEERESALLQR